MEPGTGHCTRGLPNLGDLVVVLLAGSLAGLRDHLVADGFEEAAGLVADLVEVADDYIARVAGPGGETGPEGGP